MIAMLEQTQKYYRATFLCIEQAASGQSLIQVLERETKIHIHKFKPIKSKTIRLQTVAPLFEAGRVKLIDGLWLDPFCKEITAFPHVPHDDWTDAVVWGLTYYQGHLDGSARTETSMMRGHTRGRRDFSQFTEVGKGNNRSRGRRNMFGRESNAAESYRFGAENRNTRRSDDLKFDTGM